MGDAVEFKNKGNEFFKAKNYPSAIEFYSKAIAADPNSENAGAVYSNRAASHIALRQYKEAISDADNCIRIRPTWVKGYFRKAVALEEMGSIDDAEKNFSLALSNEPSNVDIQDRLGKVRNLIKGRNEASTPEKCKTPQEAKQIGNSFFKQGSYDTAIAFYTRAIDLAPESDPERGTYYMNRATCFAQTSSHKMVISNCEEALAIDPKNAKALLRRAMAFEGLEKWQKALDDYKAVVSQGVNSKPATEGVTRCQRAMRSM